MSVTGRCVRGAKGGVGELAEPRYYFGMKAPIGADVHSGAAHGVAVTAANEADIGQLPNLLRAGDAVRQAHRPGRCLGMPGMPVIATSAGRGRRGSGGM